MSSHLRLMSIPITFNIPKVRERAVMVPSNNFLIYSRGVACMYKFNVTFNYSGGLMIIRFCLLFAIRRLNINKNVCNGVRNKYLPIDVSLINHVHCYWLLRMLYKNVVRELPSQAEAEINNLYKRILSKLCLIFLSQGNLSI